jgi:hypothetical protein
LPSPFSLSFPLLSNVAHSSLQTLSAYHSRSWKRRRRRRKKEMRVEETG